MASSPKSWMLRLFRITACIGIFANSLALAGQATDLQGKAVDPLGGAGEKAIVLVFVRTDCPISNRYAPEIQRLSTKYASQATFWLIFPSRSDTAEKITTYLHEFGYEKISALRDPGRELVKKAGAQITPEVAVFDAQHKVVYHGRIDNWYESFGRARSAATTHELDDALAAVTQHRQVATASAPAVGCYISDLP
jgi:Redoxin